MATVVEEGETAPISLYVALAPETRGDLEVISRAAIAWAEAIREAALITDPFLEVRVELVSGTEGSISLNSLIRAVRGVMNDPKRLRGIALAIAVFFGAELRDWVISKGFDGAWDWLRTEYSELQHLTADELNDMKSVVQHIVNAKSTREKTRKVYAELIKDDTVTGVGVSLTPAKRPTHIVPRSEFADRADIISREEMLVERRMERDRLTLTLMAPALDEEGHKWKFQLGSKIVWAFMGDEDFKKRLEPGSNSAPRMVTGIRMDVDLETLQEKKNGVWTTISQTILKVHHLAEPVTQGWLGSPAERE